MASVRALDSVTKDWTFGKGRNNYLKNNAAVIQNINTRLSSFLGDCFFDTTAGIDWFSLLGSKNRLGLELAISSTILNTTEVTGILNLSTSLNPETRSLAVSYAVQTTFTVIQSIYVFDLV